MTSGTENRKWGSDRLWNRIAFVSGIFAALICVLLVANYLQYSKADPVNMTVINSLVERLSANPADSVLRKDIRTLDSRSVARVGLGYKIKPYLLLYMDYIWTFQWDDELNTYKPQERIQPRLAFRMPINIK